MKREAVTNFDLRIILSSSLDHMELRISLGSTLVYMGTCPCPVQTTKIPKLRYLKARLNDAQPATAPRESY